MKTKTIYEAESTVRFALLGALIKSAHLTKIDRIKNQEILVDDLCEAVQNPATAWAFAKLAKGCDK